jgi:DNA topoisomerase-1
MQVAQGLYEGVDIDGETTGLITYMRTDGITMVPEAINEARAMIGKKYGARYVPPSARSIPTTTPPPRKPMKRCVPPASTAPRKSGALSRCRRRQAL